MDKYRTVQKSHSVNQRIRIRLRLILQCFLKVCTQIYLLLSWIGHEKMDRGKERVGSCSYDLQGVVIKTSGQELSQDDAARQLFKPHAGLGIT